MVEVVPAEQQYIPEQEDEAPEAEAVNSKSFRIRKSNIKIRQFTHMESEKGSIWLYICAIIFLV